MSKLTGKVAVVTGASKGIGAGIAKKLASEGATVVVNYASSKAGADKVVSEIESAGGKAVAIGGDVAKVKDIQNLFAEVARLFGRVDVLVNNAGVFGFQPLEVLEEATFDRYFGVNVKGLLFATKAAVALFPQSGGSVINIGSVVSEVGFPNNAIYAATKGAVDTITRTLATELGPRGIRVNSINPGMVRTEGAESLGIIESEFAGLAVARTPLGRLGEPKDIAGAVALLASDDAGWITGSTLQAAGGFQ